MEEAKQGAADIEERKEIEIRIMQIKIKRHAQNNQTNAIPTKIGMQSKLNLWGLADEGGGGWGRTKHLLSKRDLKTKRIG